MVKLIEGTESNEKGSREKRFGLASMGLDELEQAAQSIKLIEPMQISRLEVMDLTRAYLNKDKDEIKRIVKMVRGRVEREEEE